MISARAKQQSAGKVSGVVFMGVEVMTSEDCVFCGDMFPIEALFLEVRFYHRFSSPQMGGTEATAEVN